MSNIAKIKKINKNVMITYIVISTYLILSYLGLLLLLVLSKSSNSTLLNDFYYVLKSILWSNPIGYIIVYITVGLTACSIVLYLLQKDYKKDQLNKYKAFLIIPTILGVVYAIPAWIMIFIYLHFSLKREKEKKDLQNTKILTK